MDIGSWLRGLGLERYEQAFRENEIDEEVLPHSPLRRRRPLPRRARSAVRPSRPRLSGGS